MTIDVGFKSPSFFREGFKYILAATLRGAFHDGLMLAAVEERAAMFIGYCGTGGLPTYLKYRSDLKNNVVEKNLRKRTCNQADTWQKF